MVTESRVRRSIAPPLKRPRGAASATVPEAEAPAGMTALPSTSTGFATVAVKLSPELLIFDPTACARRTVMTVSAGITIGLSSAAGFFSAGAFSRDCEAVWFAGALLPGAGAFAAGPLLSLAGSEGFLLHAGIASNTPRHRTNPVIRTRIATSQ